MPHCHRDDTKRCNIFSSMLSIISHLPCIPSNEHWDNESYVPFLCIIRGVAPCTKSGKNGVGAKTGHKEEF